MINTIKNNLTIRKGFIFGVSFLVIINILFITGYYRLFLARRMNDNIEKISTELKEDLDNISSTLINEKDITNYLNSYVAKENVIITISNSDNEIIKTFSSKKNKKELSNNNITVSKIINIKENHYLISLSKKKNVISLNIALDFFIFEIINIALLTMTGIFLSNFKILGPITSLSKDFNNYKLGIIPHKRPVHGEIDNLQNDFVDLVNNLEDEKQKQNRIIASISHDIKTPLTSILGYSERLLTQDSLSNETKHKYATTIHSKSLVMKEIVEEFDDYLSCNIKDENKTEKISIKYLVNYLNDYYKEDLKEKDIEFKVKTNCPNATIEVDLAKIKRIFSNIITNSIRHFDSSKKKNIIINITSEKNDKINFDIADNGTGCKEDLKKIFEPLFTTDKSRKISGLGLSICKEIIESHNGTIKAINNKMGGFSIIFTIDAYKED